MPREYSEDFKRRVINRYEKGESILALSQELGIAQSTIYHWRREYCAVQTPDRVFTPKEIDSLVQHVKKLEDTLEVIRASGFISAVSLGDRLAFLEKIYRSDARYSVHTICEAMDVARGTFYNHIFRRADRTAKLEEEAKLMLLIQQIFNDSGQRFGAGKIRVKLLEAGVHMSTKRISALMRRLDMHSVRPDAKKQWLKIQSQEKKNILERNFVSERPNQFWVSDITCFKICGKYLYLCAILDLFSRRIVGYRVSENASTQLVTSTFKSAFSEREKPKDLTFHSDRGKQYTSKAFTKLLRVSGVIQSFSASGSPHDNAVAESFFGTFKKEEAYRREYTSEKTFRKSVDNFIRFYNETRPHMTLNYKTPAEFEKKYFEKAHEVL